MRFRSRLSREGISLLLSAFTAMSTVHHTALLLLSENMFRVSVISENIENPRGFLEINASELFSEYRVESAASNVIACEVSFALLITALTSGSKHARQIVLKLSKMSHNSTNNPLHNSLVASQACLSVMLDAQDQLYNVDVLHELPLRLLKVSEVLSLVSQPNISSPSVSLRLPNRHTKLLRHLIDKLTKLCKILTLKASHLKINNRQNNATTNNNNNNATENNANYLSSGRLSVTGVSEIGVSAHAHTGVSVTTFLSHLRPHFIGEEEEEVERGGAAENHNQQYSNSNYDNDDHEKIDDSGGMNDVNLNNNDNTTNNSNINNNANTNNSINDMVVAEVQVSAKKLVCLLDHLQVPNDHAALFFSPGEALVLFLQLQPLSLGALTFYLPVLVPLCEDNVETFTHNSITNTTNNIVAHNHNDDGNNNSSTNGKSRKRARIMEENEYDTDEDS